jgi:phosphomannomutase
MNILEEKNKLFSKYVVEGNHSQSDYISLIKELVNRESGGNDQWKQPLDEAYELLFSELSDNRDSPVEKVKFGTSGWRGILGKDIFAQSVCFVTTAIIELYETLESEPELIPFLGVGSLSEAKSKGCVVGFDNRFGGGLFGVRVATVLSRAGFKIYYAGESTTGVLSAAVLELGAAFSINLTPSHNPLEYGGYKYNAADGGPAAPELTEKITEYSNRIIDRGTSKYVFDEDREEDLDDIGNLVKISSLEYWRDLVKRNENIHGLNIDRAVNNFLNRDDMVVVIDCVHGASRLHMSELFNNTSTDRFVVLRGSKDVTFGGVAPEPSSENMRGVVATLRGREQPLKLGAIIDPDGDRIRFTDGESEISMNQFGAMAYHFLHEYNNKKGMVAKTVATSNLANKIAADLDEDLFEPSVGFKNFKPVINKAVVYFEESDGISIIGHTPEKDAYIGLLLALEMMIKTGRNLGDYLKEIEDEFGAFYPDRDGVVVSVSGDDLLLLLGRLDKYEVGETVIVGGVGKKITEVITIDGRKMIFDDNSWLMIRPSGTEPKVRFYVESRTESGTADLVNAAKEMLSEVGLL